jgi:flagellar motor switch protein FliN/FliY
MTADHALRRLAEQTAEAVAGTLRMFLPEGVEVAAPGVLAADEHPLAGVAVPGVAAEVSYVDGASGGNAFVTTTAGVRKLAAAMMGAEPPDGDGPLSELELSAVAEAMNQMMAAAAGATSAVLGQEVEISTPAVREIATEAEALALVEPAAHATRVELTVAGEPCRLVQLVPKAFIVKMTRALDDLSAVEDPPDGTPGPAAGAGSPGALLRGVALRVSAEIGRASMPLADAVSVPAGGLIELDRTADEPVDLLVNGRRFATGRLVLVDDEWAVRVEDVFLDPHDLTTNPTYPTERS